MTEPLKFYLEEIPALADPSQDGVMVVNEDGGDSNKNDASAAHAEQKGLVDVDLGLQKKQKQESKSKTDSNLDDIAATASSAQLHPFDPSAYKLSWKKLATKNNPCARGGHSIVALNSKAKRNDAVALVPQQNDQRQWYSHTTIALFGGGTRTGTAFNDLYTLSLSTLEWTKHQMEDHDLDALSPRSASLMQQGHTGTTDDINHHEGVSYVSMIHNDTAAEDVFEESVDHDTMSTSRRLLSHGVLIAPVLLMLIWIYNGLTPYTALGFSFASPMSVWKTFNWHPLMMTLSFCCLFGHALVSFRWLAPHGGCNRRYVHMMFQLLAFVFATIGIVIVILFKQDYLNSDGVREPQEHFYTVHSYIGIITYGAFTIQLLIGLAFFWKPEAFIVFLPSHENFIRSVLPWHVAAGHSIFICALLAIVSGINSRQWTIELTQSGSVYSNRYVLGNISAMFVVAAGLLVFSYLRKRHTENAEFWTPHDD